MSNSIPNLKIVFPDFFNHVAEHEPNTIGDKFPYLTKLLNRGQIAEDPQHTLTHEILSTFGWDSKSPELPNLTAYTAALDGIKYSNSLYRADPVHLRADGMQLRLFSGRHVAPDASEAESLIKELNRLLPESEFICGRDPSRWYIRFPDPLDFVARTPFQMHQQIIDDALPTGPDSKRLHSLLNEFQMVMHQSEINETRELNGKPVLNSVWVWGSGDTTFTPSTGEIQIYGGDFFVRALAEKANIDYLPAPVNMTEMIGSANGSNALLFLNLPPDAISVENQEMNLSEFEGKWCEPIYKRLKTSAIKSVSIVDNYRRLTVSFADVWKFWRRTSYFSDRLSIDLDPQKLSSDISPHDAAN